MARKKKQKDIEEAIDEQKTVEIKRNSELTDDEKRALLLQHKSAYVIALADKKAADAEFKNICKKAKAECGKDAVAEIKDALALEEPGGKMALEAEIARKHRIARWMGLPVGAEPMMFEMVDRRPAVDIAYDQGKSGGMAGVTAQPPYDTSVPQYQRWLEGWHDGQEILASAFKKLEPLDVASETTNDTDTSNAPFAPPDAEPAGESAAA
jgi:ribosome modulation factor